MLAHAYNVDSLSIAIIILLTIHIRDTHNPSNLVEIASPCSTGCVPSLLEHQDPSRSALLEVPNQNHQSSHFVDKPAFGLCSVNSSLITFIITTDLHHYLSIHFRISIIIIVYLIPQRLLYFSPVLGLPATSSS